MRLARVLCASCFLLVLSSSRASSAADIEAARAQFAEGVRLFQQGDYEGARHAFLNAHREHHAPVISYNLGRVEERLNHPQAAVDAYERYLAEAYEQPEYTEAAVVAVAQIKARSARLIIDSDPAPARVFINGLPAAERTPATLLVPPGRHVVVVEGEDFRASETVTTQVGESKNVRLKGTRKVEVPTTPGEPHGPELTNLVYGAAFHLVGFNYFGHENNLPKDSTANGVLAGLSAEVGYAITTRTVIMLRGLFAIGSECRQVFQSHIAGAGPALAFRVGRDVWITTSLLGGNGETCRQGQRLSTDIVFSPSLEVGYAVTTKHYGQWLVSLGAGFFFANPSNDQQLLYIPAGFGPRFF